MINIDCQHVVSECLSSLFTTSIWPLYYCLLLEQNHSELHVFHEGVYIFGINKVGKAVSEPLWISK